MDKTKLRVLAGICGALFGLAAILAFGLAGVVLLMSYVSSGVAIFIVALTLMLVAGVTLFAFARPRTSVEDEAEAIEESGADSLADLPFQALQHMVEKRPLITAGMAAFIGYQLISDPKSAKKHAERFIVGLL